jgi:lipopolysaccharide biosynthesis glycosyltransferase
MPERTETPHVACACGPNYLPHCATMLHSLIDHQRSPVHVHLLASGDLAPAMEERLSRWVQGLGAGITVHRIDEKRLRGLSPAFSITTWYRILLPELLPELDRVLYLDSDLIVTDSLDPLLHLDLSGNLVGAVTNLPITMEWMTRRCAALGLPGVDDYFNAGVLVMNLGQLRSGDWTDRVIGYALAHADHRRAAEVDESSPREVFVYTVNHPERLLFSDQDAINAVLYERRLKLHPRWNFQLIFDRFEARTEELTDEVIAEARNNPAIRHFEGPGHSKPWHPDAEPGDRELYWAHRRATPWATRDAPH